MIFFYCGFTLQRCADLTLCQLSAEQESFLSVSLLALNGSCLSCCSPAIPGRGPDGSSEVGRGRAGLDLRQSHRAKRRHGSAAAAAPPVQPGGQDVVREAGRVHDGGGVGGDAAGPQAGV